ncbi:MAG: hypothetical protein RR398_06920 [Clostridia bacterium]
MRELYRSIKQRIGEINFNEIFPDFHIFKFALYNKKTVYFDEKTIPYDNRFLGNATIKYDGENIAIWCVEGNDESDYDILASKIVHEMFHAFQCERGETRFPHDLLTLRYPMNAKNFEIKHFENLLLTEACVDVDIGKKNSILKDVAAHRNLRKEIIGEEMLNCELFTETIEGMAEYAGCMALKQLSEKKFKSEIEKYIDILTSDFDMILDIRKISYYVGAILCIVLSESDKKFKSGIGEGIKQPIFNYCLENKYVNKDLETIHYPEIAINCGALDGKRREKIAQYGFFKHGNKTLYPSKICGYDPMNMMRVDNNILCTNFIILKKAEMEPLFLDGPILLELNDGTSDDVIAYYKRSAQI